MTIKEQIMLGAFDLFSQYGIKSVSMDDIARSLSISKRTIYEFFDDKEALLTEGMELKYNKMSSYLEQLEKEPLTTMDIILLFYEELLKNSRWYNNKFYEDLKKYPKALQKAEVDKTRFIKKCMSLFSRGVKEGMFLEETNFEIMALLAKEQAKMLRPSGIFCKHSTTDVYNAIFLTFLKGISTEKGRSILDRFSLKQSYK